ncbi:MAG: hypothetical protein R3C44_19435 [Chloroflexota bacterium]
MEEVEEDLPKFKEGLAQIKADGPATRLPHLTLLKQDVRDLKKRLAKGETTHAG